MAKSAPKTRPVSAVAKTAEVRPPTYEAEHIDISWWKTSTLKPAIIMAQLEAEYQPGPGPIRHVPNRRYVDKLFDVIDFARRKPADFCVFPEFSWPASAAAELWDRLRKSKAAGVFVLPFEHMTVGEYMALLQTFRVGKKIQQKEHEEIQTMMPFQQEDGWVNGAIVVVRTRGRMRSYPQRKLRPALLEERGGLESTFVKGSTIRIFKAANCTFSVLICFDFISRDLGLLARPCDVLTKHAPRLDLLIVPECNPQPLHDFYLKTTIDLYQTPAWAQRRPVLIFNNVAAGTRLASSKGFGFTRVIGNLGNVATSDELLVMDGYVAADEPKSLADIQKSRTLVKGKRARTLVFRPEQSVFHCDLPPLETGAAGDRQASSIDTQTEIFRPVGPQLQWQRVRDVRRESSVRGTSAGSSEKLAGAAELQKRFRRMIDEETLLVVKGAEGSGKTALVSTTVRDVLQPDLDRLVWIDLAQVEHTESALVEEVLLRLGRAGVLASALDEQYAELVKAVRAVPTILVLDSADSWGDDPLPEALLRLHGWKTLVVVAGRYQPAAVPQSTRVFEVTPLTPQDFTAVVEAAAGVPIGDMAMLTFVMYASSGGSALVAVWTGQFIARNRAEADRLNTDLRAAGERYLTDIRKQMDTGNDVLDPSAQLERIERIPPPVTLDGIYEWFKKKLNAAEMKILDVLCEMPSGLRTDDLAQIVGRSEDEVAHLIERLFERNLVQTNLPAGDNDSRHAQHQGHPFVRHLWAASNPTLAIEVWEPIVSWTAWVLKQHTPERDPRVSPINVNQWPNLAHVLRTLARGGTLQKKRFLELWRMADRFLWAAGRWRERYSFGCTAEAVAREIGDFESEITAIYDAQAETSWYRNAKREDVEKLLERASALAAAHGLDVLSARIEWYRSRMLLHLGENNAALEAAQAAVALADTTDRAGVHVMTHIALGNAYRETDQYPEALEEYDKAADFIEKVESAEAEKTRAIIDRNRGRVHIRTGQRAESIRILERAMTKFHDLDLEVLEAETAVYYAEALAKIGESAMARRHLEWGRQRLNPLGSKLRQRDIARAEHEIEDAMLRR